jgi:hypothetical protein
MRIATVDGVKDGKILCTIALEARGTPLVGQYVTIPLQEDLLLGRMGSIDLTNPIHAAPNFKPYIMAYGSVPQWSREVDIETSEIETLAVIDEKNLRVPRRNNPSTGTDIEDVRQEALARFFNEQQHVLVLGMIPNTKGLQATIRNRHFGAYESGGWGEAHHTLICGQNGSAKTVLASQKIAGQLVAYPTQGLLIPDTAGDLSTPNRHHRGDFRWDYLEVLKTAGVQVNIIDVSDIRLTAPETLKHMLRRVFMEHFAMHQTQAGYLADQVTDELCDEEPEVPIREIAAESLLERCLRRIPFIYSTAGSIKEKQGRLHQMQTTSSDRRSFERAITQVRTFFDGREKLGDLIDDILQRGRKVIIRMHQTLRNEDQAYVMHELMDKLVVQARNLYNRNIVCNAQVVLDEGPRWIPEGRRDTDQVSMVIENAFRETRKYGLGWMVISQRMSAIAKIVLSESHTRYFGRGLGVGVDREHLEQQLGKVGLEAYDMLELQGGFFWVGIGHDNNLGTEGNFFTLHPFGGDATAAFMAANPTIFRRRR